MVILLRRIIETTLHHHRLDATRGEIDRAVLIASDTGEIAYACNERAIDLIADAMRMVFKGRGL